MDDIIIRRSKAGEASYVSYLQMKYYECAYGFKGVFEHYLLASMAEFVLADDGSGLWVALDGDEIIGAIAIVKAEDHTAQLRWFIIDEQYQGRGIGRRLMDTAMRFCRERGYSHVFLWTLKMLVAARHLYEQYGFSPTEKKANTEWTGEQLIEERWDLCL